MATVSAAKALALSLPRSYEALVGGRIKIRVGRLVYLTFSPDEQVMGFAFPKHLREALIRSAPEKFTMPRPSDERYNWVRVHLPAVDEAEMRALVVDAWAMVVPKSLAVGYLESSGWKSSA